MMLANKIAVHIHYWFSNPEVEYQSFQTRRDPSLALNPLARRISDSIQKGDTAYCPNDMNRPPILPLAS